MLLKRHPYFQVDEEKPATDPSDGATNGATSQTAETTDDTRQFFKVMWQITFDISHTKLPRNKKQTMRTPCMFVRL